MTTRDGPPDEETGAAREPRGERNGESQRSTRAIVLVPVRRQTGQESASANSRSSDQQLAEAISLAEAINLEIVATLAPPLRAPSPATLLGAGKVEEIAALARTHDAELIIVDHPLSPVQQRNLETAWSAKVLDRTGLILEIFGDRAQTSEGRLQVELAHLNYQKGRLVRSWTHLERQRGGFGFLGGPGETQIEADRRQIDTRIRRIEGQLDRVRNMRSVHRAERKRVPRPVAALVGYTNAGKSTLFNRMTGADILAKDMVFATLDPTLRRVRLPHDEEVILSDTVGFISDLPTTLVAAFRATLEEVQEADLILHVRDIASPETAQQAADVDKVLGELGIRPGPDHRMIEVWNKIDRLEDGQREALGQKAAGAEPPAVLVSAQNGDGLDDLLRLVEATLMGSRATLSVELSAEQLGSTPWLYENTEILDRQDADGRVRFRVRIAENRMRAFQDWAQRAGVALTAEDRRKAS